MIIIVLTILFFYILLFLFSLKIKDNSLVDVFWGFGFMIIVVISWMQSVQQLPQYVVSALVLLWGIRLTSHIGFRKLREGREDPRYAKWREEWGNGWYFIVRSFLQVYMLQMVLMLVVAMPILIVNLSLSGLQAPVLGISSIAYLFQSLGITGNSNIFPMALIFVGGILIALAGLLFETIADLQLREFMKIKKPGQIFTTGLYRYSRHPNYFGESVFWFGLGLVALPFSPLGLIGWIVITVLLLFVSGVPLQEIRYAGRPEWEEYKKRTSVFVPWFPKK